MIPYLLHVALLISVCLLFYKLLLQRETFYRLNRVVLIFCLALSFALPLIPIPQQWALRQAPQQALKIEASTVDQPTVTSAQDIAVKPAVPTIATATLAPIVKQTATVNNQDVPLMPRLIKWLFYLYWIGVAAFGLNLLMQIAVLLYQAYTKPAMKDGRFRIVELSGDKAPCSFGNSIFINPEKYDWDTYSQILLHEKIHIQQGHSFDIIIAELVLVLQWFNPFAWLYRTELENNLEFLTDSSVLEHKEVERESYQMSLLKVSAPHLSLGITTNYNQSLLKKRIVMMNAKKSNIHIMWKYFFLVPLLGVLACALNDPAAYSMTAKTVTKDHHTTVKKDTDDRNYNRTEGAWFATIKNDKVHVEFKSDDDDRNWSNSSTFPISEFSALPKDQKGEFTLKREAGTVVFTGKFEGEEGYGHYKFTADKSFNEFLSNQGITEMKDGDSFAFFTLDIKKDYILMLQKNGYKELSKNNLISMSALKVDEAYINMWKANGYNNLSPNELVSGKALGINGAYVSEIRKTGYKDISFNQLVSFKAHNITGAYINGLRKTKMKDGKDTGESMPSANEISSYKAMNIDSNYVHSLAAVGYKNIPYNELTTLKALNITAAFIKSFKAIGYTNLSVNNLTTLKSLDITPAYVKGFEALGYKNLSVNNLSSLKALGIDEEYIKGFEALGYKNLSVSNLSTLKSLDITEDYIRGFESLGYKNLSVNNLSSLKALGINEEYIKSFEAVGYKNIPVNSLSSLKALDITPDFVKGFKDLGFTDISINQLSSLKATGVTPAYVTEMRGKGFNSTDVEKYVRLKTAFN